MKQRLRTALKQAATLTIVVGMALVGLSIAPRADAGAAGATIGQRAGFAPTSWMLLWGSDAELNRDLDTVAATGAKWLRFDFDWASAEPSRGSYNWSFIDRVVAGADARGLSVLGTIAYTPAWARPAGTTDKAPPTNLSDYTSFVSATVARYAPRGVRSWEIWNEPNIVQFWQPKPDVATYTSMLRQSYGAIKAIDPGATVVSAGLAPAGDTADGQYVSPRAFINRMYTSGAKGSFDALGMHPYAYPYGINAAGDWNQWSSLPKTRQLLVDNGDGAKKIWATEYGAPTGTDPTAVTEAQQAQFVTDAFAQWTNWTWTGPLFWYGLRDAGTDAADREQMFGQLRKDFTPKPALGTFTTAMAKADPNGATQPAATTGAPQDPPIANAAGIESGPLLTKRLAGADAPATAAAISAATFPDGAPVAYLANRTDFADALGAGPAAGTDGPVLLTDAPGLPAATTAELQRLRPQRIVVVGGERAVSDAVLQAAGRIAPVSRVGGRDRYDTAALLSATSFDAGTPVVYVASGNSAPDGLVAGTAAARARGPVLLTTVGSVPDTTLSELRRLSPQRIVIVGGSAVVGDAAAGQLATVAPTVRLAGPDRYSTAASVAAQFPVGSPVIAASGDRPSDGLAGVPLAAVTRAALVLLPAQGVPAAVTTTVDRLAPPSITVLGGTVAVPRATETVLSLQLANAAP